MQPQSTGSPEQSWNQPTFPATFFRPRLFPVNEILTQTDSFCRSTQWEILVLLSNQRVHDKDTPQESLGLLWLTCFRIAPKDLYFLALTEYSTKSQLSNLR